MTEHQFRALPPIVAILKLLHVLLKMLLRNMDVSPADRKLQPCPKTLDTVNMAITINILSSAMIDRFMIISGFRQSCVGFQFVGVNRAALFHVLLNNRLQRFFCER